LKKLSIILTLSALLTSAAAAQAAPATPGKTARQETPPNVALTPEVMYKYLASELAFQRGEAFSAYATMLALARSTRDARLARRATEFAAAGSLSAEALKAARVWRELAPHSEEASQALVSLLVANGRIDEAKQMLAQQLAASTPEGLPATIVSVQRQLARMTDRKRGTALLRELLEPYRDSLEALLTLAQTAMVSGERAVALTEARAALARHPSSEVAALTLAQVIEDKAESANVLGDFLKANPKAREVRLAYSRMLFEQNRVADARAQFEILLQQYPNDQTTLYALGLLSVQSGDLPSSEKYLSAYIATLGGQPDRERDASQALLILAQIAEDRNDISGAMKWLEMVDPANQANYLAATVKRAQLLARSGRLDEAREVLHNTDVEGDDERARLIVNEAQLLRDAGRLDDALKLVADALKVQKDNVDLLYEHAMLAEKANQLDLMERELRRIIQIAPDNQHAYNALGYSLADRNLRLQEAYDLIRKANELAPEDPFIMDSLGWVEFRLGRYEQAEKTLRRAFGIKADPEIAAHLGEVLWVLGREDEARQLWRDANAKDPKNSTLKGTLQRLQVKL
jgi:tetratricopeptide (TPR) repeat protein